MARLSRIRVSLGGVVGPTPPAPIVSSGSLQAQIASIAATTALERKSSGTLEAQISAISGTATIEKTASGILEAQISSTTGVATVDAGATLNNTRISAMHFQRHYEPIAVGA